MPFVLRACCGGMCWPVDRPATHAAAGAAARGGFCFGEFFCGWTEGGCGGEGLTTGVVRHACRHRVTARGVFGLGGALLPFVLRACCGGMCWPVDRPATHAAAGAAARGGFCFGEFFCGWTEGGCGGEGLTTGVVRHACRHRVTARGVFGFVGGGAVAVCFEGCCGSMCWPVDRPATHAAAGAAARGVRGGLGDSFTRLGVDGTRGLVFVFLRAGRFCV